MPKAFLDCVKNGGNMVTADAGKHHYVHGCIPKGSNKPIWGERKKKKEDNKNNNLKK